jgi:hypothetical protein
MKHTLVTIFYSSLVLLGCFRTVSDAQSIAYESFSGLPLGSGVVGSGSTATGWADNGWSGGSDSRFQIVDPLPNLSFQISGGNLVNGGDRSLRLSTLPEPVPGTLVASRSIIGQNTTLYFSFLFRPDSFGTGTDSIEFRINAGTANYGRVAFRPNQNATSMTLMAFNADGAGIGVSPAFVAGETYLIVARWARPSSTRYYLQTWVNPTASTDPGDIAGINGLIGSVTEISNVGFSVTSTDVGGPGSVVVIDELRIGYTWSDVVLPGPALPTVPNIEITQAARLQWQTQVGKIYQVQVSYNLSSWANSGSAITGNGSLATFFDSTEPDAKKFYRVNIK